jgi:hypothetical protein
MRVTNEMLKAANLAVDWGVQAGDVEEAVFQVEDTKKITSLDEAETHLKGLETELEANSERYGIQDEIDHIRIYLAVRDLIPKEQELTLTVKIKAPDDLKPEDVAGLVHRLILNGQEEAGLSQDVDEYDPEADDALELEVVSVSAQN